MSYQRVFVLLNYHAGTGSLSKQQIEEWLSLREKDYEVSFLNGEASLETIRKKMDDFKPDLLMAVGGDGTVNFAGQLIADTGIVLMIIPTGTGNGLSKDLRIPGEPSDALAILEDHQIIRMDALSVNGHLCLHLSDLGFNAEVVRCFSESRKHGVKSYFSCMLRSAVRFETRSYEVITPEQSFRSNAFMITLANSNQFGSEAVINPDGLVDDGFFEIIIIKPFPWRHSLSILYHLYKGNIRRSEYSKIIRCKEAVIINRGGGAFHIDGEALEAPERIEVSIKPSCLQVMVPRAQ